MQKTQKKQLTLNKERLRLLTPSDLVQARGGIVNGSSYNCDDTMCECRPR